MARCANLPVEIRNGDGFGGGEVVGWLPIVSSDSLRAFGENIPLIKSHIVLG